MKFDNSNIRRQDRLLNEAEALRLLSDGEYGFLAMAGENGGYGIPLNYVWDGESVWFHCAPEGEKLRHIASDERVTFCVVGTTAVQPSQFTTAYESVLVSGKIEVVTDDKTKMKALALLVAKYSPQYKDSGAKYAGKSLHRTAILRLCAERISGKAKVAPTPRK